MVLKELEKQGIDAYNVGEISKYAAEMYKIGKYDETLTELKVNKLLNKKEGQKNDNTLY